jgi:DUF1680 family protein
MDTSKSPAAKMYMVDLGEVRWTGGFWGDRFDACRTSMIPYLWTLFQNDKDSHAWSNFMLAAGLSQGRDGRHHGPPFNDGDFLKWLESVAQVYAVTKDPELDRLMDRIIDVVGKAQREDGYLHTQKIIPQRQGVPNAKEFQDRDHFETYNMGHLMTAACVHYRATGKTSLLVLARKAADYLHAFYTRSSPELARNAICPSHYMGVVELYRVTREPRYLELARQLIEIRDLVEKGSDQNQDRVPFRQMKKALGHAVRANYLYAGVADVYSETGDKTLMSTLEAISGDVAANKLYITGMTGALYDGASPDGSKDHPGIQLVHQAYGRDYQLPNATAYNETCATIGYAMWVWRMLELTGDARYADLFEQSLYNGVLPGISLEGTHYFYVNPLRKLAGNTWPLRWSRTRQPNIQSSFCCPPNVVRTIAETQNYLYTLSKDSLWVHLYGASSLNTSWTEGGRVRLRQESDYPWKGDVKLLIDEAPARPIALKLRIPGWMHAGKASLKVNGAPVNIELAPASYAEVSRLWKEGDVVELSLPFSPVLMEANLLVEEARNQVAVKNGPLVYCLESNDLPSGVNLAEVAVGVSQTQPRFSATFEEIDKVRVQVLSSFAFELPREAKTDSQLYREVSPQAPRQIPLKLVPYFAWGNRGDTEMSVWMPQLRSF